MKILFMGTPDFAVPCLLALLENNHQVCSVFTQTDKAVGRKQKIVFSDVKKCAIENNIEVFQPTKLKNDETKKYLEKMAPELIVVVAYGKILPEYILNYPKYGCINIHGSLLPKYRGAAPIQWSVINGEQETGVTSMYMDKGLDTGDMIIKNKIKIGNDETSGQLYDRMKLLAADTLIETIKLIENNQVPRQKQNDSDASFAPMLSPELSPIDFNKTASEVHNKIRGLNPWPGAYTKINGKKLKIYLSSQSDKSCEVAGVVVSTKPFVVACGDGKSIEIKEVQLEGKKRMSAANFMMGSHLKAGDTLG